MVGSLMGLSPPVPETVSRPVPHMRSKIDCLRLISSIRFLGSSCVRRVIHPCLYNNRRFVMAISVDHFLEIAKVLGADPVAIIRRLAH